MIDLHREPRELPTSEPDYIVTGPTPLPQRPVRKPYCDGTRCSGVECRCIPRPRTKGEIARRLVVLMGHIAALGAAIVLTGASRDVWIWAIVGFLAGVSYAVGAD